jgi:hypothetical protein
MRSAITEGASSMVNVTVRSNPCSPAMSTRNPPLNGSGGDPRFMRATCVSAACDYSRLDALTPVDEYT